MTRRFPRFIAALTLAVFTMLSSVSFGTAQAATAPGVSCTGLTVNKTVFMHPLSMGSTNATNTTSSDITEPGPAPYTLGVTATLDPMQHTTITGYRFDFGDGSPSQFVATSYTSTLIDHTYQAPATYTASVTVNAKTGSGTPVAVSSPACRVTTTLPTPTYCKPGVIAGAPACDTCELYPTSVPSCLPRTIQPLTTTKLAPTPTAPSAASAPASSVLPTRLVDAGAGGLTAVFFGAALLSAVLLRLYFWYRVQHHKAGG